MLTVVFSTKNRAAMLPDVFGAFAGLLPPRGGWKLVVVDNASTDATQAVLDRFRERLPLEVLFEPRPGKNAALNRAIASFAGDLVVVTDDDVLPEPDWLQRLQDAAGQHPEAAVFGGTILPAWPRALPSWLDERWVNFGVLFALLRRHSGPCGFSAIYGPNMAVRHCVFAQGHRFDDGIGPDDSNPLSAMGSETEFTRRLLETGYRAHFVAEARVRHIIRPEQLQESWILTRAYRNGLGAARTDPPALTRGAPLLRGLSWRLLLRVAVFRLAARAVTGLPPSGWRLKVLFKDRWFAGLAAGVSAANRQAPARRSWQGRPVGEAATRGPVATWLRDRTIM